MNMKWRGVAQAYLARGVRENSIFCHTFSSKKREVFLIVVSAVVMDSIRGGLGKCSFLIKKYSMLADFTAPLLK